VGGDPGCESWKTSLPALCRAGRPEKKGGILKRKEIMKGEKGELRFCKKHKKSDGQNNKGNALDDGG